MCSLGEGKMSSSVNNKKKLTRREALSTAGKVAVGVIVAGAIAGAGGYYAGLSAAPARTVEKTVEKTVTVGAETVTKTVGATATVTKTVTAAPATTTVTAPTTVTITSPAAVTPTKLEIYSGLSIGQEKKAMLTLLDEFHKKYPHITPEPAIMGWDDMHTALDARFSAGNPPDAFIDGSYAYHLADAGQIRWVDDIWEKTGIADWVPDDIQNSSDYLHEPSGHKYALFNGAMEVAWTLMAYNLDIFKEYGIQVPFKTWDDFWSVCEDLKKNGITPLAFSTKELWFVGCTATGLWFNNYPDKWEDFAKGKLSKDDPAVKDIFETIARMGEYANLDHPTIVWAEAVYKVARGDAAMVTTFFSCWGAAMVDAGITPGVEAQVTTYPAWKKIAGVEAMETVVLANNAPHPDAAAAFGEFWVLNGGRIWCETRPGSFLMVPGGYSPGVSKEVPHYEFNKLAVEIASQVERSLDPGIPGAAGGTAWSDGLNDIYRYVLTKKDAAGGLEQYEKLRKKVFG